MAATDPKSDGSGEEPHGSGAESGPSAADLIGSEDFQAKLEAARRKRAEIMAKRSGDRAPEPPALPEERPSEVMTETVAPAAPADSHSPRPVLRAPAAREAPKSAVPTRRRFPIFTLMAMLLSFAAGGALVVVVLPNLENWGPETAPADQGKNRTARSPEEPSPPGGTAPIGSGDPAPAPKIALPPTAPTASEKPLVDPPSGVPEGSEVPAAQGSPQAPAEIAPPERDPPPSTTLAKLPPSPVRLLGRDAESLTRTVETLRGAGLSDVDGREVEFAPSRSVVRFYRSDDRPLAHRLAERLDADVQDLTGYSSASAEAGVEVWLAGP